MKILDSNIAMSSTRTYLQSYEKTESLKTWVGNVRPVFEGETQNTIQDNGASLEISDEAKKLQECNCNNKVNSEDETASEQDMVKIKLIETFVEFFTGKKIKIRIPNFKSKDNQEIKISQTSDGVQAQRRSGWGLEYEFHETKYESEKTTFASKGIIKTCDGKEINFTIDLSMSREFMQQTDISLRAGDAKLVDPLVINFGGNSASLTQTKFSFDLDVDGNNDQISFVSENSGFLAIDKNNDGNINDGSELFGPTNGDGFSELQQYDIDKNGWIDENDEIFDNLRIWTKDESGNDKLFALGQKGIGAIFLGNVDTQFSLNDSNNNQNGEVKSTGIFVNENGSVGTIQHVNLTI